MSLANSTMEVEGNNSKDGFSSSSSSSTTTTSSPSPSRFLLCFPTCFHFSSSPSSDEGKPDKICETSAERKPGGWKAMPYVLGNETFERFATVGLLANFMVYLMNVFHLNQVSATSVINIWSGVTGFAPLLGAFISDAWLGRFKTLAFASIASFLGMIALTLTAIIPTLHPPSCTKIEQAKGHCIGPTSAQIAFLIMSLGWISIGSGGIRPCSIPFGVDQFDNTTEQGRKDINSFFNWYYVSFTLVIMIAITVVVYIQDSVGWGIGFGIPTGLMLCSIILFFLGTKIYVYVPPEGSVFSGIAQVLVAAYKKRKIKLLDDRNVFYDPPLKGSSISFKIPVTPQFRALDKAAVIMDGEVNEEDGSRVKKWRLTSVQQVEEVKCLIRVIPIWASGILCFVTMTQQGTFTVSQALKMDRHLGHKFQIPAGSLGIFSMMAIGIWIPVYDRIVVPKLRKITKQEEGITLLQRMGIGLVFSIFAMIISGLIEEKRRASAILHGREDGIAPMSVLWLAPQLFFMGLAEGFSFIGQIEFYYKQFPDHMKSVANALPSCTWAVANYVSALIVAIVHKYTGRHGKPDWLDDNINIGRVDYYYYLIAVLGTLNLVYFLVCSNRYHYKRPQLPVEDDDDDVKAADGELKAIKNVD